MKLLETHLTRARGVTPPGSAHAFDLADLQRPEVTFWSAWEEETLQGVGALVEIDRRHGEVKSMHTAEQARRRGVGSAILTHIIQVARRRGYTRLSLETGKMPYFEAARRLYERFGFVNCAPFANYAQDPNTVYMTLALDGSRTSSQSQRIVGR